MFELRNSSEVITSFNCTHLRNEIVNFDTKWCELLSEEFINITPKHWLQFHPPSCTHQAILAVLYFLIVIPGLLGNGLILCLFVSRKCLQTPTILLSVNIALSDLIMNLKIPLFIYNSLNCRPAIGVKGCELYGFVGGLSGTATIISITVVTIERYLTITNGVKCSHQPLSFKRAIFLVIAVWVYASVFSLPPLLRIVNRYVPEGYLTTCTFDYLTDDIHSKIFITIFFFGAYLVPLSLILFSYISIYLKTVKSTKLIRDYHRDSSGNNVIKRNQRRQKLKLGKTTFSLITLWTLAWSPYAFVALFGLLGNRRYLTPTLSMFPALFAKCASVIDPYVYGSSNSAFRKEIKLLFLSRQKSRETNTLSKTTYSHRSRTKSNSANNENNDSFRSSKRCIRKSAQETFV